VLAPSHPEAHERLSELALRSGKPVYIDKPFAVKRDAAERMFRLAEKSGTPLMSSSALRFATECLQARKESAQGRTPLLIMTRGGGACFDEYVIHQVEMVVALMGCGVQDIRCVLSEKAIQIFFDYPAGRSASLTWHPDLRFAIPVLCGAQFAYSLDTLTGTFPNLISGILEFFRTRQSPIPQAETMEIVSLVEAAIQAVNSKQEGD